MSILDKLTKTMVRLVQVPVAVTKDVVTMGGMLTDRDRPYTADAVSNLADAAGETSKEIERSVNDL